MFDNVFVNREEMNAKCIIKERFSFKTVDGPLTAIKLTCDMDVSNSVWVTGDYRIMVEVAVAVILHLCLTYFLLYQ